MSIDFNKSLAEGQENEFNVGEILLRSGYALMPSYSKIGEEFRGPRILFPSYKVIAPDMLAFRIGEKTRWVEVKSKDSFTPWVLRGGMLCFGINEEHYLHYVRCEKETPFEVWLVVLNRGGVAKDQDSGVVNPAGLYAVPLSQIELFRQTMPSEIHKNRDESGVMVIYFPVWFMNKIASIEDMNNGTATFNFVYTVPEPPSPPSLSMDQIRSVVSRMNGLHRSRV